MTDSTVSTPASSKTSGRWLRRALIASIAAVLLAVAFLAAGEPRPEGEPGPAADELARQMMAAIDHQAWERTGAVRWSFRGKRHHLWDRERQLVRVRWDDLEVLVDLTTRDGVALRGGRPVADAKTEKLVRKAWEIWVNDSFWLNPISKVFDDGTVRGLVEVEDGRGLLVEYTSGGATPGDAYLWIVGADGLPSGWKMWTSNLPVGGMRASWEDWVELATGARVATAHKLAIGRLELTGVAGAASLSDLEPGADPFAVLVGGSAE